MQPGTSIEDHMDEFNRLILDLENIEVKVDNEDQMLLLICSLSSSCDSLVDTLIYGRESLTLEEVQVALMSKELSKKSKHREAAMGENLTARGRSEKRDEKGKNRSRSKSKTKLKCFLCHKEGHFKRNCPEQKSKKRHNNEDNGDASIASNGYESTDVLVTANCQGESERVMDSGCSFHMCPNKHWFFKYESFSGGSSCNGKQCNLQSCWDWIH